MLCDLWLNILFNLSFSSHWHNHIYIKFLFDIEVKGYKICCCGNKFNVKGVIRIKDYWVRCSFVTRPERMAVSSFSIFWQSKQYISDTEVKNTIKFVSCSIYAWLKVWILWKIKRSFQNLKNKSFLRKNILLWWFMMKFFAVIKVQLNIIWF